jgi:hypothetical protein
MASQPSSPTTPSFALLRQTSLTRLPSLVQVWLPQGRQQGQEWVALTPRRQDSRPGSFKVNLRTGRWTDFATGDKGGDAVSLLAYLRGLSQAEAAQLLACELGVRP